MDLVSSTTVFLVNQEGFAAFEPNRHYSPLLKNSTKGIPKPSGILRVTAPARSGRQAQVFQWDRLGVADDAHLQ